jgi:hypothetical protein
MLSLQPYSDSGRNKRFPQNNAVGCPGAFAPAALLLDFLHFRTMTPNLLQSGIRWRGTFHPLKALKGNRV